LSASILRATIVRQSRETDVVVNVALRAGAWKRTPEVAAEGHDRCLVPINPENIDAWLNRNPENLEAMYTYLT